MTRFLIDFVRDDFFFRAEHNEIRQRNLAYLMRISMQSWMQFHWLHEFDGNFDFCESLKLVSKEKGSE